MTKPRLLITGGTGFIGGSLTSFFREHGYFVEAPKRQELDLTDPQVVRGFVERHQIDLILHSACEGVSPHNSLADELIFTRNQQMFIALNDALPPQGRLIHLGSGAEYDKRFPIVQMDESAAETATPQDVYGRSKQWIAQQIEGLPHALHLRLFGVYGVGEGSHRFITQAIQAQVQGKPIRIRQNVRFSYLWIDDLAKIVERLIETPPMERILNVTPNESITLVELAKLIQAQSSTPSPIQIEQDGLQPEYTGSNLRLLRALGDVRFTSYVEGVVSLYHQLDIKTH
ncbi:MAG: NAD-dependent epimerase/dehydratase family protein [Vampirovibrionales bacterium]|jgi:GDP-L-fucose synthase|nr:NAD-dependent epimerase/dehydratase family protein [Vampirovibrionales bacterium]